MSFGWDGDHLHRFRDGRGREWGESSALDRGGYMAAGFADEEATALGKAMRAEGAVLEYLYDFGDSWLHRIEAEEITTLDPGVRYPRCTGGRRAAPPTEDIGGIWGLEEVVYLVTHPEADPPEHFEDLIRHLRGKGHDPGAFDPAELTARLSGLTVRLPAKAVRTRRRFQRLTSEDLEFCTCGRCQAGDPVRSVDGAYLSEKAPSEAEVFPVITLPARTELAAQARRVPLIEDALRLAEWCAPARQVTAKGVLKPPAARQAVEELRLWQRADELSPTRRYERMPWPACAALETSTSSTSRGGSPSATRSSRSAPGAPSLGRACPTLTMPTSSCPAGRRRSRRSWARLMIWERAFCPAC